MLLLNITSKAIHDENLKVYNLKPLIPQFGEVFTKSYRGSPGCITLYVKLSPNVFLKISNNKFIVVVVLFSVSDTLSCVWPFCNPWTVGYQAPLPTEFHRKNIVFLVAFELLLSINIHNNHILCSPSWNLRRL